MPLASASRGRKLYYESHGDGPGPPLVLVTGMAAPAAAGTRSRCRSSRKRAPRRHLRPPRRRRERGSGRPVLDGGPRRRPRRPARRARASPRAHVLGVFLGGMVAQELALRHPMRVARLVLAGCYARARREAPAAAREVEGHGALRRRRPRSSSASGCSGRSRTRRSSRATWSRRCRGASRRERRALPARPLRAPVRRLPRPRHARPAQRLHQPTLLLCGRNDQLTPPKLHRAMADAIPGARLVTFQYGAHLVMAESAESFNRAVCSSSPRPPRDTRRSAAERERTLPRWRSRQQRGRTCSAEGAEAEVAEARARTGSGDGGAQRARVERRRPADEDAVVVALDVDARRRAEGAPARRATCGCLVDRVAREETAPRDAAPRRAAGRSRASTRASAPCGPGR